MKQLIKLTGCIAITDKGNYITSVSRLISPATLEKWLEETPKNIKYIFFKNESAAKKFCSRTKTNRYIPITEEELLELDNTKFKTATLILEAEE